MAVAAFLSCPEPCSFFLHRVQCVVSLYDILLQRYLYMNLFHSVFSGVACILFYFAYYVELNLTQKVSDHHIPKSLGLPVLIADWLSPVFPCLFDVFTFLMSSI